MPDGAAPPARIGPNAVLQLLAVLDARGDATARDRVLARAGLDALPSGDAMIAEDMAVRLHHALRHELPQEAPSILRDAGRRTADYLLAHRIPRAAHRLLRALPPPLSARLLTAAISRHAWTFAGSGRFRAIRRDRFEIADNAFARGVSADHALCVWHEAVFARLYGELVASDIVCIETACAARDPGGVCRFELTLGHALHRDDQIGAPFEPLKTGCPTRPGARSRRRRHEGGQGCNGP
ncbi:V4R domain protein [Roseivivax jejudonensis]|uniref:V4R domain protein n=1 Tax=Roseivivax jejudonensis TaxID=1529041 RepID=A0A1X6ZH67_9RHOB|nr:bacteriochlorophyll 4-vinyl reductase [Roseivivax jejudonensis]SLN51597.1 V4R domain protein [Roseivivax jejudonensis]